MASSITKQATNSKNFARPAISFPNARTALKAFLLGLGFSSNDEVLLPAYIGWSQKEGSGVFDPIREIGAKYRFYRITRKLCIDLEDLLAQMSTGHPRLLIVIHYFGFPDPSVRAAIASARERDVLVLEDEAHALYSDWVSGICGRLGDAAIFSLHKLLPFRSGGMLVLNHDLDGLLDKAIRSPLQKSLEQSPLDYDLAKIAAVRRYNATKLLELLRPLRKRVTPLYDSLPEGVVPQTLPVLVTGASRDELYFTLNEHGYGVVSLYHTLVEPIDKSEFPDSHWLARRILNLPVHQDVSVEALKDMIAEMEKLL